MILSLFRKTPSRAPVYAVYAAIVAQSRRPVFYAEWGVPDTVTGRFDMISLHLALLFRRLRGEGDAARAFSQLTFDLFFQDMDRSLREMGAGDLAVPKKIQKMSALFYGLLQRVAEALDAGDVAALEAALQRNVLAGTEAGRPRDLAEYLMAESRRLAAISVADITSGRIAAEAAA